MVKPDGVQRNLTGEIIARFEKKGIKLVALKMLAISPARAEKHYAEHADKPFFKDLVAFITSGPVVAMVLEGENVIATVRAMMGATHPKDAATGSIRGDYALTIDKNVIHGSDSPESAAREIDIFFSPDELISYAKTGADWI
jgi:nucleoside-diphosphate kinase